MSNPPSQGQSGQSPHDPPPQGGFGPPLPAPGQPAYGYPPEQPAGQPGYGYPQVPAAPGPYGYGAATNPYGQPPPQPYGPPAPTVPGGVPAPPPRNGSTRAQLLIVLAAVVAIAVIVATGFWLVATDRGQEGELSLGAGARGDRTPAAGAERAPVSARSRPLLSVAHPKVDDIATVKGSWLTDTVYAKTNLRKIVGYDLDTGATKWTIPLPGQVCAATSHMSGDLTAILFEPARRVGENGYQRCTEAGVLDLGAGQLVWSRSARGANSGDQKVEFKEITVSGQTVAAGGLQGGAAWNLADGASRWVPKSDPDLCYDLGYAGGGSLAALRKCGRSGSQYLLVQSLDPVTGAPASSYKMSPGIEWASIVSTEPLVVAADLNAGGGVSDLFSLDARTGALRARIALTKGSYAPRCDATAVEQCMKIVVGNGRVYLPSAEHQGGGAYGRTNEIVSFDLATGKQTTDRADAGGGFTMFPLRMDGPNVIAYKRPTHAVGGQIVSIDASSMRQTVLMKNPDDEANRAAESSFSADQAEIRYREGRLFTSESMVSKPYEGADREYLIVSFTTH
ncbi:hypothetical protein [Streptomyces sp. NPDC006879]|uniref:hypothetical protein n=1 Tax=Streptomyces sp. NPDC006879 TaxID=3364767 RepID=UPI00367AAC1B